MLQSLKGRPYDAAGSPLPHQRRGQELQEGHPAPMRPQSPPKPQVLKARLKKATLMIWMGTACSLLGIAPAVSKTMKTATFTTAASIPPGTVKLLITLPHRATHLQLLMTQKSLHWLQTLQNSGGPPGLTAQLTASRSYNLEKKTSRKVLTVCSEHGCQPTLTTCKCLAIVQVHLLSQQSTHCRL